MPETLASSCRFHFSKKPVPRLLASKVAPLGICKLTAPTFEFIIFTSAFSKTPISPPISPTISEFSIIALALSKSVNK